MSSEQAIINERYQAALHERAASEMKDHWAVVLDLAPFPDGNQWCVLWGEDIQNGVAAFGDTPYEAIRQFEVEMHRKLQTRKETPVRHERRVVGHASGWQEQMDTCACGEKWPCPRAALLSLDQRS